MTFPLNKDRFATLTLLRNAIDLGIWIAKSHQKQNHISNVIPLHGTFCAPYEKMHRKKILTSSIIRLLFFLTVITLLFFGTTERALSEQFVYTYVAQISRDDQHNSSGQRLTTAAAILRQDRANYHRFNIRDKPDQDDELFADKANRLALEQMIKRGHIDTQTYREIVNGLPLVQVTAVSSDGRSWAVSVQIVGYEEIFGPNAG
ncbi:MAG: hypothetical protein AAF236_02775 [Verrucomicrobiota bacterium]